MDKAMPGRRTSAVTEANASDFSILVTCYCEDSVIEEFHARLSAAMCNVPQTYEIVYVDDGSSDTTFEKLASLFESDTHVGCVVRLLGNVGQTSAQTAAIAHANGRHFIFIDADLQVDPEDIVPLIKAFAKGRDLVSGYRTRRCDPLLRRVASMLVNGMLSRVSKRQLKDIGCGFKVLHGELIRSFRFNQHKPFRPVSVIKAARSCVDVPINHHPRRVNKSGWTLLQLFAFYRNIFVETAELFFHVLVLACLASGLGLIAIMAALWFSGWSMPPEPAFQILLGISLGSTLFNTILLGLLGEFAMRNTRMFQDDPVYIVRELLSR